MNFIFSGLWILFQFLGKLLFDWWGWVPLVAILGYLIWQNTRRTKFISATEYSLLMIEVPKDNDKQELSAEQMFASLHGILRPKSELMREGVLQEHISFEIVSVENQIRFYVWTPKHLKNFVEGQIYAQYPSVNIHEVEDDYAKQQLQPTIDVQGAELGLVSNEMMPIKTFKNFEVDPLAGITAVLAKLEESGEQIWIQILTRPIDDSWHNKGETYIQNTRAGRRTFPIASNALAMIRNFFEALIRPPTATNNGAEDKVELSDIQKTQLQAVKEKISKLGYEVKIRFLHLGPDRALGRLRVQSLFGAFKQFNDTNNGFTIADNIHGEDALIRYRARLFTKKGFILNIEELASVYHLPHTNVETPSMVWANIKTAEPPANLPTVGLVDKTELSPIGSTNFRGGNSHFGIKRGDRGRHMYVIG